MLRVMGQESWDELGWGTAGAAPVYSLHRWPSSSPWVQSWWKSQACPSRSTVPFQQVKELCNAILEPGDVPGRAQGHTSMVSVDGPNGQPHWKTVKIASPRPAMPIPGGKLRKHPLLNLATTVANSDRLRANPSSSPCLNPSLPHVPVMVSNSGQSS